MNEWVIGLGIGTFYVVSAITTSYWIARRVATKERRQLAAMAARLLILNSQASIAVVDGSSKMARVGVDGFCELVDLLIRQRILSADDAMAISQRMRLQADRIAALTASATFQVHQQVAELQKAQLPV